MPVEVEVTRVVEMPVEVEVSRVVERIVTRVVEKSVEVTATQPATDDTSIPTANSVAGSGGGFPHLEQNVALLGSASTSNGQGSAPLAIDDDPGIELVVSR